MDSESVLFFCWAECLLDVVVLLGVGACWCSCSVVLSACWCCCSVGCRCLLDVVVLLG